MEIKTYLCGIIAKKVNTMRFKEEINESYTMAEAIKEAQRCLHCKVPQCKKGCPISYGIPEYRLPKEVVAREIRHIEKMGVLIHRNTHVGVEITVDSLFAQGFDAIFIGTGLGKPKSLEIPVFQNGRCITEGDGCLTHGTARGAVGATPNTKIVRTTSGLENDERKFLITREVPYGMTTRKGVFAGGDVANRQATVVHAMQDAKKVALGIAQYVDAVKLMQAIDME